MEHKNINLDGLAQEYKNIIDGVNIEELKKNCKLLENDKNLAEREVKNLEDRLAELEEILAGISKEDTVDRRETRHDLIKVRELKIEKEKAQLEFEEKIDIEQKKIDKVENAEKDFIQKAENEVNSRKAEIEKLIEEEKREKKQKIEDLEAKKEMFGKEIRTKEGETRKQLTSEERSAIAKLDIEIQQLEKESDKKVKELEEEIGINEKELRKFKIRLKQIKLGRDEKENTQDKNKPNEVKSVDTTSTENKKTSQTKSVEAKPKTGPVSTEAEVAKPKTGTASTGAEVVEPKKGPVSTGAEVVEPKKGPVSTGAEVVEQKKGPVSTGAEVVEPKKGPVSTGVEVVEPKKGPVLTGTEVSKPKTGATTPIEKINVGLLERVAKAKNIDDLEKMKQMVINEADENDLTFGEMLEDMAQDEGVIPFQINSITIDGENYMISWGHGDWINDTSTYKIGEDGLDLDRKSEAKFKEFVLDEFPESENVINKIDVGIINVLYRNNRLDLCKSYIESLTNKEKTDNFIDINYDLSEAKGYSRTEMVLRRNARNNKKIANIEGKNRNPITRLVDFVKERGANLAVRVARKLKPYEWEDDVKQLKENMKLMLPAGKEEYAKKGDKILEEMLQEEPTPSILETDKEDLYTPKKVTFATKLQDEIDESKEQLKEDQEEIKGLSLSERIKEAVDNREIYRKIKNGDYNKEPKEDNSKDKEYTE